MQFTPEAEQQRKDSINLIIVSGVFLPDNIKGSLAQRSTLKGPFMVKDYSSYLPLTTGGIDRFAFSEALVLYSYC